MKRIRFFALLAGLLLVLTACAVPAANAPQTQPPTEAPTAEPTQEPEPTEPGDAGASTEPTVAPTQEPEASVPGEVRFERKYEDAKEYAVLTAVDLSGSTTLWTYTTGKYDATELDRTSPIGMAPGLYLLNEGGTVTALDAGTGEVVWQNDEFGGCLGLDAAVIDVEGNRVLLSGYYGPDLFACDLQGKTLFHTDSFDSDYLWPHSLSLDGPDQLTIHFEMGPDGEEGVAIAVDLSDLSFTSIDK